MPSMKTVLDSKFDFKKFTAIFFLGEIFLHIAGCWLCSDLYPNTLYLLIILIRTAWTIGLCGAAYQLSQKPKIANLLLIIASFGFLFAAADAYVLFFRFDSSGVGGQGCFTCTNRYRSGLVKTNDEGYWEKALEPFKRQTRLLGETFVAVIGDSFTNGQGLRAKHFQFTEQLEKKWNESSASPIRVFNFGLPGADTRKEINKVFNDAAIIAPDIVLIAYLANDIPVRNGVSAKAVEPPEWALQMLSISPAINFLYWRIAVPQRYRNLTADYAKKLIAAYKDAEQFEAHMKDLEKLITQIRGIGAQPAFVLLPFPHMWKDVPSRTRDEIYQRIVSRIQENGVPALNLQDLEERFSLNDFQVNPMDAHPNEKVHEAIAEALRNFFSAAFKSKMLMTFQPPLRH